MCPTDAVAAARAEGAGDNGVHATVQNTAAFRTDNRYVTSPPTDGWAEEACHGAAARRITEPGPGTSRHPDTPAGASAPANGG
ncbi:MULTISPECIES: hypothetical protein [unclassified Streptomyces]|uniref:hypothetical protein n=1 Tax=unclassified Streptomyces TaxID=2593676 RepID=UPI00093A5115|nr:MULTISPECIES: hypothetical protein [unclassified Streptomyces]MBT2379743.1 hypothetical protein [Streptomyces sp. ISL-111]MBT2426375.1 hypothetical protein [Streptomyces sp. ISL-112]MBT2465262.1 hypothetical protein [Streptomyces sp. ISL-63]